MKIHEKYINRCLELGGNALGIAAPNPMVGAVIVYDDRIIGEGFTSAFGQAHAEVNAIKAVNDRSLLKDATLYVSLEPCCHHGKTPPCTNLILDQGIQKVVIGITDPNEKVSGKGVAQLREAGCEVIIPVLEEACREHHRRFLTVHEKKRPYIILKWAETSDHFLAPEPGKRKLKKEPFWITSLLSQQLVHQWRSEEQAILVGAGTVLADDPLLTVRHWHGNNPTRFLWDTALQVTQGYRILQGNNPAVILTEEEGGSGPFKILSSYPNTLDARKVTELLYKEGIQSVLIEGGHTVLQSFIGEGLWDEARVFEGAISFGKGIPAPSIDGRIIKTEEWEQDKLTWYRND